MVERYMADNITEVPKGTTQTGAIKPSEVAANASTTDEQQRLQDAQELLGVLTPQQEEAILQAHKVGEGQPGKTGSEAGIDNYTREQIGQKARILKEAGFSKEQRRTLMKSRIVGVLPAAEFATFDPATYTDARLSRIAQQIRATGDAGRADEEFMTRTAARIERMVDEGTVDETQAQDILNNLERWRIEATAERPRPSSRFENIINAINQLEQQPPSLSRDAALEDARKARDYLLEEANNLGLFRGFKPSLHALYRSSRIDVPPSEQDQRMISVLNTKQQFLGEPYESDRFWSTPELAALQQTYRGAIDYFRRGSTDLIIAALENPRNPQYPDNGVGSVWNYNSWVDREGISHDVNEFDDLRKNIEQERKERPRYIGARYNYLFPAEFIVDGIEELEEAVDDFNIRLEREVLTGSIENMDQELRERHGWGEKAMQGFMRHFGYDASYPLVMRLTSKMNSVYHTLEAAVFAGIGREAAQNYLNSLKALAEGFRTVDVDGKKINEHYFDVLYFDKEAWMPQALDGLSAEEGVFWRYGSTSLRPPSHEQMISSQEAARRRIIDSMAGRELRSIDDLLNTHPAFIRLKGKLDTMDPTGGLWQEYVEEARAWERFTKGIDRVDGRNPNAQIKFEHPLARVLTKQEFDLMYQPIQRLPNETDEQFNRRINQRRQQAEIILKRAERLATALLLDTRATAARIRLKDANGNETGEVKSFMVLLKEELMKIVDEDAKKPLGQRRFKVYHVLKNLGLVDFPTYAAFNVGADDDLREQLLKYFEAEPELKAIIDARTVGVNAKTTIVRLVEHEREIITLLEHAIRRNPRIPTTDSQGRTVFADGTDYYNYGGYDTPGGGVKYIKNILYPYYGISRDTVQANGLIPAAYYGVHDFLFEFGCSDFRDFVGWQKRRDEVELAQEGPAFKNPRDIKLWVERLESVIMEQSGLWTRSEEDKNGPKGGLNAPISGAFLIAAANLNPDNFIKGDIDPVNAITNPDNAIIRLKEVAYRDYLKTVMGVYEPAARIMRSRAKLENVYGAAAGTAKFLNTLYWNDLNDWMDYRPDEYRGKFGFAIDARLRVARYFANTGFYEDRLIYYDNEWDEIMLGTDPRTGIKVKEGIIDTFPQYYWPYLPYLKETRWPEVIFNTPDEESNRDTINTYKDAPTSRTAQNSRLRRIPKETFQRYGKTPPP